MYPITQPKESSAPEEVLQAAQALYEQVAAAQRGLAGLRRFEGTYTEDHLARLRAEAVQKANEVVEQRRREVAKRLEDRRAKARAEHAKAREVNPQSKAAAMSRLQLLLGGASLKVELPR